MAQMTWDQRERPILDAIAQAEDGHRSINNDDIAGATGLDRGTVDRGLLALVEAEYVTGIDAAAEELCYLLEVRLLERGRRAAGAWPSQDAGDELLRLLRERAEAAVTDEERTRWQRLVEAAKGLGSKALTEVAVALVKREAGL